MKFSELVRLLEHGFSLVREKGSIRYYAKPGVPRVIRIDFHGAKGSPDRDVQRDLESRWTEGDKEGGR